MLLLLFVCGRLMSVIRVVGLYVVYWDILRIYSTGVLNSAWGSTH